MSRNASPPTHRAIGPLVAAELVGARSTRSARAVVGAATGFAGFLGFANASIAGDPGAASPGSAAFVSDVLGVSAIPAAIALLLGVMATAGRHQHGTAALAYLITPRRNVVAMATAIAAAIAGAVVALGMMIAAAAVAFPIVVAGGDSLTLFHREAATTVIGLVVASATLGALGTFLGSTLRSQTGALVAVGAWALVIEGVVDLLAGGGLRAWMPGGVAADLVAGRRADVALAVLLAWTAVVGFGAAIADRRDVV